MKYGGSWASGFAKTFSQAPSMFLKGMEWGERRKEKKLIEDAQEEMKANAIKYATKFDAAYKDGIITPAERSDMVSYAQVLGDEFSKQWAAFDKGYVKMEEEQIKAGIEEIDSSLQLYLDFDIKDTTTLLENLEKIKSETRYDSVRAKADYAIRTIKQRTATPQVERYATLEEFHGKYKEGAAYEHDKEGYIVPKFVSGGGTTITDYQRKRKAIEENPNLSKAQKFRGLYKLDTGIDIGEVNDTEDDFTTAEGKRTLDLAFTTSFGYTTPDGTKIAGIVPSRLARQLSMGRKATEEEKEEVLYDWNLRKATTLKLGGKMAVKAVEDVLNQLFRETKPADVVTGSVLDKANKYIDKILGREGAPTEGTPQPEVIKPEIDINSKMALIPTLTNDELKKQANAAAQEDTSSELYAALYEECKKRGLIK